MASAGAGEQRCHGFGNGRSTMIALYERMD
jgi:hypothetical protein